MGVESLSNEELLAIILRTGTKEMSVFKLVIELLETTNGLYNLSNMSYNDLIKIKGIKQSKACIILALFEIAKRANNKPIVMTKFKEPETVYNYFSFLKNKKQEYFYVLYLNNKNVIIKEKLLYIGTIKSSLIDPKDIFKEAYLCDASGIIMVHNHPSLDETPSKEDIIMTKRISEIGLLFGINVLDHIIIGKNYYSIRGNHNIN
jgi:DNA repair protein RadC